MFYVSWGSVKLLPLAAKFLTNRSMIERTSTFPGGENAEHSAITTSHAFQDRVPAILEVRHAIEVVTDVLSGYECVGGLFKLARSTFW